MWAAASAPVQKWSSRARVCWRVQPSSWLVREAAAALAWYAAQQWSSRAQLSLMGQRSSWAKRSWWEQELEWVWESVLGSALEREPVLAEPVLAKQVLASDWAQESAVGWELGSEPG